MNVAAPLFLITSSATCWRCQQRQHVVALGSPRVDDDDVSTMDAGEDGALVLLQEIETLPEALELIIRAQFPNFTRHFSQTAELEYYANHCECGANFGDFYLHKAGGPFGPLTEEDAAAITLAEVALPGPFEIDASWGMGPGELIAEFSKRT